MFLSLFALKRGWITGASNPNLSQAAKQVLKDYTTGKIVFCNLRPDFDEKIHKTIA